MYKYFPLLIFSLFLNTLYAKEITPTFRLDTQGFVTDFVIDKDRLYAATDMGSIDIFDLNRQKLINQIRLEPLRTAQGKLTYRRIFSVDRYHNKTLFVSSGKDGFRNVWVYENNTLTHIIDESKKMFIKEARFVNDEQIMFATFASEMILYDRDEHYQLYNAHISQSTLGDIVLNEKHNKLAMSDESGAVKVIDVDSSKIDLMPKPQNLDNVYKIAYKKGVILTAGQDRRVGVYPKDAKPYYIKSDFLVYCVGLSPSAKTGVYSSGEDNDLQLFDVATKRKTDRLIGHKAILNTIVFTSEYDLFSSSDEQDILYWRLD